MLLTFDQAISKLVISAGMSTPVTSLYAERGDAEIIELEFLDNGQAVTPTELEVFRFVAKPEDDWQAVAHVKAGDFTYNASTGRWQASVNYNADLLNALLLIGSTDPAGENAFTASLMCQLAWKPTIMVAVSEDDAGKLLKMIDALEEDDDVQTVWGNYDVSDEVMAKLG
jgi:hypothetical protein